jgi:hypothetical protein
VTVRDGDGIAETGRQPCTREFELQKLRSERARWKTNCRDSEATVHEGKRIVEITKRLCTREN